MVVHLGCWMQLESRMHGYLDPIQQNRCALGLINLRNMERKGSQACRTNCGNQNVYWRPVPRLGLPTVHRKNCMYGIVIRVSSAIPMNIVRCESISCPNPTATLSHMESTPMVNTFGPSITTGKSWLLSAELTVRDLSPWPEFYGPILLVGSGLVNSRILKTLQ
ncbi:hypothetical protein BGY98DRAFT_69095 [Russula aff. rugulosa BPL654]|nr:hypothetical protein BGY98DRAFT_69095 [Russula aff. rugulosa BPL654]